MITLLDETKITTLGILARQTRDVFGAVAECGVFMGGSLRVIAEILSHKTVYGFDTFKGLPVEQWSPTEKHKPGDFSATSLEQVQRDTADLSNIVLVPGIFPESAKELKHLKFAFVHVDFDFYMGTKKAIKWFKKRMSPGGIMLFDDYGWTWCPGVKRAIDEAGLKVKPSGPYQVMAQL